MSTPPLTTTSYAILGLLAIRPWTTYELAQQMQRSLRYFWPRAQSSVYEEPKRLATLGLASATKDSVGRRPRTTYAITPKGRRALRRWLDEPGGGPTLEFEALLKCFYGDQSSTAAVRANIEAMAAWARTQNDENVAFARQYASGDAPFDSRVGVISLTGKFMVDFADMVLAWTEWAKATVAEWPDDAAQAPAHRAMLEEVARRPGARATP